MKTSDLRPVLRLSALTALVTLAAGGEAEANPKGGQVVAGSATIAAPSSNQLDITQSTDRAAINWMSFNIAPNERTNFQQPSSSSMTLNRVQAGDPSLIAGRLTANGQIVLVNPSGIVFAKGSQVDVNSLIATPSDISNANFMAGRMKFDRPSSDPRASVVNHGTITVAQKGFAALVAPGVANSGVIQAKLGKVVLAGAETYTVDFYGDGLINFDVGSKVATVPRGPDGKPVKSLVSNSGEIDALGGRVLLTAAAAAGIVENVVDVPGRIVASASGRTAGKVTIDAGAGNAARLAGNIDVSGLNPGQVGGTATVTGGSVALVGTARIDARGNAGGGTVMLGGGPHGKDPKVRNARTTTVAAGAVIDASATGRGKGGDVTVWADDTTVFDGSILARGGPGGGHGGWAETSGTHTLVVGSTASVSAASPKGKAGGWLLDPDSNIDITTATLNVTCAGSPLLCHPTADSSTLDAATIVGALNGGTSVTVSTLNLRGSTQPGDIAVDAAIALANPRVVGLTLLAGAGGGAGAITVNRPISDVGSGGALSVDLTAGGGIAFASPLTIAGSLSATAGNSLLGPVPSISQTAAGALKIGGTASFTNLRGGGKIALNAAANSLVGPGGLNTTGAGADASLINNNAAGTILAGTAVGGALSVTSSGPITQAAGSSVTAAGANLSATGFPITLTNDGNDFDTVLGTALAATGTAITIHTNSMQFGNILATGPLSVTASTGPIIQLPGTTVTAAGTTLISGSAPGFGNIILANAGNDFNTGGTSLAVSGAVITIADANALQLGNVTAAGTLSVTAGGAITQTAATSVTAAGTTLTAVGFPITVANPGNDFDTGGTSLAASGAAITIADANALQLGNVTASGPLSVTSLTGPITQAGDARVVAAGTTLVSGVAPHAPADITLDSPDNDFDTAAGTSLTASGASIAVFDTNTLRLRAVTATGILSVAAGGAITQADPIVAPNLVVRTLNDAGAPITLDDLGNTIPGNVTLSVLNSSGIAAAPGAISFVDSTGFTVARIGDFEPGIFNQGRTITLAATGAGARITNATTVDSTRGAPGGDIAILADAMTLAGGTVNAGTARVVLGPYNPTRTIRLVGTGGATAADALNLTNADLATVTTSLLQIGASGAGYSNGTITASGTVTSPVDTLVLVSAGDIADAPPDTIRATNLGLSAGGSVHLKGLNAVSTLAGTAGAAFAFADDAETLTIGVVPPVTPPVLLSVRLTAGVPSTTDAVPDRFTGITAQSVSLRNTGNVTIADPVTAVTSVAIADGGVLTINAAVSGGAGSPAGQFYSDAIAINAPVSFPGGLVQIAPNTPTFGIDLAGAAPPPATLELSDASLDRITAQTIQLGFVTGFTGPITVSGVVSPANAPNLALVTSGAITEGPLGAVAATRLALWAGGSISFPGANTVQFLAGRAGATGSAASTFLFRNVEPLTIDTVDGLLATGGSDTVDPSIAGVATRGGNIVIETTGLAANLTLAETVNANGYDLTTLVPTTVLAATPGLIGLSSAGTITQTPAGLIVGAGLALSAVGDVGLGEANRLGANDVGGVPTGSGSLAGDLLSSVLFRADHAATAAGAGLVVGTVDPVDSFGARMVDQRTGAALTAGLSGVVTPGGAGNIIVETTVSGNLVLNAAVNTNGGTTVLGAAPGLIGLSSAGTITQTPAGLIVGAGLALSAVGDVGLGEANRLGANDVGGVPTGSGSLAGDLLSSVLFRADHAATAAGAGLVVGTVDPVDSFGARMVDQRTGAALTAGLSGVVTAGGNILLETTTSGNLALNAAVTAGTGSVALASAGTLTQDPAPIVAASLAIASADRVSLGAFGGPADLNQVGTLAGKVVNAGQSFVFRNDALSLTIGTVDVSDSFGNRLAALPGPLSGVVTNNANIGLRVTTSGNLLLTQNVAAGTGGVGFESAGQIRQTGGTVTASALEVSAVGAVSLPDANVVGVLAGQATGAGNSLLYRNDNLGLTIDTVATLLEQGTGTPPSNQMLSVGALSGVVTNNGNILLETTTAGNLVLSQTVNAGIGSVALGSAGTLTQAPPIIASALAIVSADRVSLGAFGGPSDPNQVGILAGRVLNPGESFVFRNDAASLTIGTVDVSDSFGNRLAALPGPLSGVVTNNANIGLRVTTSGNLLLTQNVAAGTAGVGLESAGQIRQTGGVVTASALEASAVGAVSLPEANVVPVLAGQTTGTGNGFLFRDDSTTLTIATVGPLLEQGAGTPPNNQMLSVGALSRVTTVGGNVALETTTAGNLVLASNVDTAGGLAALIAAGNATEAGGSVAAAGLIADAGAGVAFNSGANAAGTLAGVAANGAFQFTNAAALTVGTVGPVADVGAQSGIRAASSTAGDVLIQTTGPGQPLTLAGDITAGGRAIFDTAGAFVQVGTVTVGAPVFAVDTTGAGIAKLSSFVSATSNADAVANLAPTGTTRNPIQFDNLVAPGSVALLFADGGVVNGIMQVSQLGLSGTGASAALFGSINGDATGTAAAQGVRNPGPESTYLFNNCIIAGTSCVLLPAAALVPPQMVSDINFALLIPFQPFSALDFATSDALRPRREENPDLPVINIFDEERLCGALPGSGEATREPCR